MDSVDIQAELRRAQTDFHQLVARATPQDLRRRSDGTRWSNRQLLWHMVFGYLIVRTLMPLVHLLGRLGWSRRFAATLNAAWRPFHQINDHGTCGGGLVLSPGRMAGLMDLTIRALTRRLAGETPAQLALTMHFPTRWDPYFRPTMSVLDVYHYGTEHYDHHHRQLTIR
jgi:heme/copper-type cytochrome/quinol oxidase subunit 1